MARGAPRRTRRLEHAAADRGLPETVGEGPRPPRSVLASHLATSFDADAQKRRGWLALGILVVDPERDALSWPERALLRAIGERLYGPRAAGPHGASR